MSIHSETESDSNAGMPVAGTPAAAIPANDNEEMPLRCGACLAFGYRDDKYCACCGARLRRLCQECGAVVLQPVAFFCTQCGMRLVGGGLESGTHPMADREKISSGDERDRAQRDRHTTT